MAGHPDLWDGFGIVLAYERLEEHSFIWPGIKEGLMTLTHTEFKVNLGWFLLGSGHAGRR
ncbi:IS66 family insertion sequence element accessory protein TnpB [Rhizobium leguminosarum]|uniref:IS66 family insertion sequence element accessory protein TnpB n=1 Tax=Rhizobium leguminosarum TaxID=384 RepID=UPI000DE3D122|nr:hypothetical protein E0H63_07335 [Rhizobium leguminosarum bv. viciae]